MSELNYFTISLVDCENPQVVITIKDGQEYVIKRDKDLITFQSNKSIDSKIVNSEEFN